ncbi:hypothetical protein EX30DRAFT_340547 [Ascodesmis nigricans]|uniref:Uncharacterized protein n=1 Tax=Ascodesmis nigricans TaxID=341454 RepID=A0A4S2MYB4_9PEZI|nr:hypothetical protein EX30DRAFT_340547 [Ascodesmis nigricans]
MRYISSITNLPDIPFTSLTAIFSEHHKSAYLRPFVNTWPIVRYILGSILLALKDTLISMSKVICSAILLFLLGFTITYYGYWSWIYLRNIVRKLLKHLLRELAEETLVEILMVMRDVKVENGGYVGPEAEQLVKNEEMMDLWDYPVWDGHGAIHEYDDEIVAIQQPRRRSRRATRG